jgi:aspartate kinase
MALLVQKFGGTSLANMERINHAADLVMKAKQAGHDVVVVVSAMAGETDRLIGLAKTAFATPSPREYAALVATGEQVTMALMALALQARGIAALSYTGAQAGIHTCSQYKKARIQFIDAEPILKDIKAGKVVVIAGFQGVDEHGSITTLGRGGSDTSAVAIAAALRADECQIFTDVEGVFTTDPNMVPEAKRLDRITFEEMLELASLGSKVLQIRSVEFAGKYNVPLRVLSSMKSGPGTLITYDKSQSMESPLVSGIAFSRQEAKLTLWGFDDVFEAVSKVLTEISAIGVNIDMMVQQHLADQKGQIMFTVHQDEYAQTLAHFQQVLPQIGARQVEGQEQLAKLSLVGAGLKSHPFVASTMFNTLVAEHIQVALMSMSEIKLSVIIEASRLEEGVRALHHAFHLDKELRLDEHASENGGVIYPGETVVVYSEN